MRINLGMRGCNESRAICAEIQGQTGVKDKPLERDCVELEENR